MKKDISNYDKNGNKQGYQGWFNQFDESEPIAFKDYINMDTRIYSEDHYHKHIEISI